MNRRSFLDRILRAGASAMILPSALTYARTWKKTDSRYLWIIDWKDIELPASRPQADFFNTLFLGARIPQDLPIVESDGVIEYKMRIKYLLT